MEAIPQSSVERHELVGRAHVRRVGRVRFPVFELVQDDAVLASMGRSGWLKVFLGRGQRIELADGSRWRLKSLGSGGAVCPAIFDDRKRRVSVSSLAVGGYGINGKAFGFVLYGLEKKRFGRTNRWILRRHEDEIAEVTRYPQVIDATEPVHVGAALVALTLVRYGVLGESRPRLKLRWN